LGWGRHQHHARRRLDDLHRQRHRIRAGWITVALPATDAYEQPAAGNSYFLYGKFQALNTAGEFYVDSSNKLYLWDHTATTELP